MGQIPETYLGDGVYASFDGYQIWLRNAAPSVPNQIALEPGVLAMLEQFKKRCFNIPQDEQVEGA